MSENTVTILTARRERSRPVRSKRALIRLAHLLIVLVGVTFLVSMMLDLLPGDPAAVIAGEQATPEQIEMVRRDLHLDQPAITRYFIWMGDVLQGNLGISYRTTQPVGEAILQRLPVSLELMILAQLIALMVAVPAAVFAAYRPRSFIGRILTPITSFAISTPEFVFALGLIYVGALTLGWFPATGFVPLGDGLWPNLLTVILPAMAIALEPAGAYARLLRSDMTRTLSQDFILAAKAKGMSVSNLLFRQALRPSSLSLATVAGMNTARLLGSVVVIETLFGIPGVGRLLVESINNSDIITVQGVVCFIALVYVVINLVTDLLYPLIDPRARHVR